MTDFFDYSQAGETTNHSNVLRHHFTFGAYYEPTKFGRSTLRRADYITLNADYTMASQRDYVLALYPVSDVNIKLDNLSYTLKGNMLSGFIVPKGTHITLSSPIENTKIILCECDTQTESPSIVLLDFTDNHTVNDGVNHIELLNISTTQSVNLGQKPFFGLVLEGDLIINDKILGFYDGFYTDNLLDITGNAKILTFTMPVPL